MLGLHTRSVIGYIPIYIYKSHFDYKDSHFDSKESRFGCKESHFVL